MTTKRQFYVQFVWEDVEPTLYGPFTTEEERDAKALALRNEDGGDLKSGIYWIDRAGEKLTTGAYSGGFFDE